MKYKILNLEDTNFSPQASSILQTVGQIDNFTSTKNKLNKIIDKYEVIIVRLKYQISREILKKAKNLKFILTATTGLDHIDIEYAKKKKIIIISLKGETQFLKSITATAEHTWGVILNIMRNVNSAHSDVVNGRWDRDKFKGNSLKNKTIGIIGLGRIGKQVSQYAIAFKMKVVFYDNNRVIKSTSKLKRVSLKKLLMKSDIISIHIPYNPKNEKFLNKKLIDLINHNAVIINTSRGRIYDEKYILNRIKAGKIKGLATDVIYNENLIRKKGKNILKNEEIIKLIKNNNILITPHIGGCTFESMEESEIFIANKFVKRILKQIN